MGFASNIFFPFAGGEPGPVSAGHRLFFKAVLGMARTGAPWRDGPARWRVATRSEKKAQNVLAFVHLASLMILLP